MSATTTESIPACPWCNTAKSVRLVGFRHYYCGRCGREFDGVDDGETGYGDPAKKVERKESYQARERQRKAIRR